MSVLTAVTTVDERAARGDLRAQIAHLESQLAALPITSTSGHGEPRLLGVGELERIRDALATKVAVGRRAQHARAAREAEARRTLEAMLADPRAHHRHAVALHELGLPGCGVYRPRPRLGVIGRLAGWWQVKLSSGCP
jgi:hypothetical protein